MFPEIQTQSFNLHGETLPNDNHRWWALAAVECGNFVV